MVRAVSGDVSVTILDGDGLDRSLVRMSNLENSDSVLEGFTITNGTSGSPHPSDPSRSVGGGLFVLDASPTVRNCVFRGNLADDGGGAFLHGSAPLLEDCVFDSNLALSSGGAIRMDLCSGVVRDCVLEGNASGDWAGGVFVLGGSPTFEHTSFSINHAISVGGAMVASLDSEPGGDVQLSGCSFQENSADLDAGGVLVIGGLHDLRLVDCSMCDNLPNDLVGSWIDEGGNLFCDCIADLDGDGAVGGSDISLLLGAWGPCAPGCPEDANGDLKVDGADLALMLSRWGLCDG